MALVLEDGTGVATANTYILEAESDTLLEAHPQNDKWECSTAFEKEIALRQATMYIDRKFRFYGDPNTGTQILQWPRTRNFDNLGMEITAGTIPTQLKQMQAEIAIQLLCDPALNITTVDESGTVQTWSTDGVAVTFNTESSMELAFTGKRFPEVEFLVKSIGRLRDAEDLQTHKLEGV